MFEKYLLRSLSERLKTFMIESSIFIDYDLLIVAHNNIRSTIVYVYACVSYLYLYICIHLLMYFANDGFL